MVLVMVIGGKGDVLWGWVVGGGGRGGVCVCKYI